MSFPEHATDLLVQASVDAWLGTDDPASRSSSTCAGYLHWRSACSPAAPPPPTSTITDLAATSARHRDRFELMQVGTCRRRRVRSIICRSSPWSRLVLRPSRPAGRAGHRQLCRCHALRQPLTQAEASGQASWLTLYPPARLQLPPAPRPTRFGIPRLADTDLPAEPAPPSDQLFNYSRRHRRSPLPVRRVPALPPSSRPVPAATARLAQQGSHRGPRSPTKQPNLLACIDQADPDRLDDRVVALALAVQQFLRGVVHRRARPGRAGWRADLAGQRGDRRAEQQQPLARVVLAASGGFRRRGGRLRHPLAIDRELRRPPGRRPRSGSSAPSAVCRSDYLERPAPLQDSLELFSPWVHQVGQAATLQGNELPPAPDPELPSATRRRWDAPSHLRRPCRPAVARPGRCPSSPPSSGSLQAARRRVRRWGERSASAGDLGDRLGQARTLHMRQVLRCTISIFRPRNRFSKQALGLYRALSQRLGQASALYTVGIIRYLTRSAGGGAPRRGGPACPESIGYRLGGADAQSLSRHRRPITATSALLPRRSTRPSASTAGWVIALERPTSSTAWSASAQGRGLLDAARALNRASASTARSATRPAKSRPSPTSARSGWPGGA